MSFPGRKLLQSPHSKYTVGGVDYPIRTPVHGRRNQNTWSQSSPGSLLRKMRRKDTLVGFVDGSSPKVRLRWTPDFPGRNRKSHRNRIATGAKRVVVSYDQRIVCALPVTTVLINFTRQSLVLQKYRAQEHKWSHCLTYQLHEGS